MTPNNREELVELIGRELHRQYGLEYDVPQWDDLKGSEIHTFCEEATQILTALESAGLAIVPVVASGRMIDNGGEYVIRQYEEHPKWETAKDVAEEIDVSDIYTAMLAASPYISSALPHLTKRPEQHGGGDD